LTDITMTDSLLQNEGGPSRTVPKNIIYSVVAKGSTVLADETCEIRGSRIGGNFATVTSQILPRFPQESGKYSYVWKQYMFHVISGDGLIFLCLSDKETKRRIAFGFLNEAKTQFLQNYGGSVNSATAYQMNDAFSPTLQKLMQHFNNPRNDKLSLAKDKVNEVKSDMIENIDKLLERADQLEILVEQSEQLNCDAQDFKYESEDLRKRMCQQHARLIIALVVVGVIILIIVIIAIVFAMCTHGMCGK